MLSFPFANFTSLSVRLSLPLSELFSFSFDEDVGGTKLVKLGVAPFITPDDPAEPDEGFGASRADIGISTDEPGPSDGDKRLANNPLLVNPSSTTF